MYCICISVGCYIAAAAVPSLKGRANCLQGGKGEGMCSQQLHNDQSQVAWLPRRRRRVCNRIAECWNCSFVFSCLGAAVRACLAREGTIRLGHSRQSPLRHTALPRTRPRAQPLMKPNAYYLYVCTGKREWLARQLPRTNCVAVIRLSEALQIESSHRHTLCMLCTSHLRV